MENITFVIWMILYPVGYAWEKLLTAKCRGLENEPPPSGGIRGFIDLVNLMLYIIIAVMLYR